jgi:CheY-like chemotaxis protein
MRQAISSRRSWEAILAAGALLLIAKGSSAPYDPAVAGFAANGYGEHSTGGYNLTAAFLVEVILTGFLVLTVLGATALEAPVGFAGIPIGLVFVLFHLVGIPVTNTSGSPARSIGPAVFVGGWALSQLWLFVVAPLIGSALAAASAEVFLGQASLERAGCILLDAQLLGMSGLALQRTLTEAQVRLPVILVTGHDDRALAEQALHPGAVAWLTKPIQAQDLLRAVHDAMAPHLH